MGTASANPGGQPGNEDNVTICHRTNAVTNPYVVITVDVSAVDGDLGNNTGQGDHYLEHQGPVFDPSVDYQPPFSGDEWGDIIPPIEGVHSGLNWTAEGIAIYENDCAVPSPTETPTTPTETPTTPTETPTTPTETPTTPTETPTTPTETPTTPTETPTTPTETPTTPTETPTTIETTETATPSTSTAEPSTSTAEPSTTTTQATSEEGSPPESSSPEVTQIETSAGALPKTGSDVPVAGAVGISLLLIGVGILLLLGPGRLIPATYHRKH
jgi:hypothetical protein